MPRHVPEHSASSARVHPRVLIGAVAVLVLLAGGIVWFVVGRGDDAAAACGSTTTVRVTVAPELADVAGELVGAPLPTDGDACVAA